MNVILISGKAGHGKTTLANQFLKEFSKSRKMSFASYLKVIATNMGWDGLKDTKGRRLLQEIGQTARNYNPNFWAEKVALSIFDDKHSNTIIIDDWRHPNEETVLEEYFNVITVRIISDRGSLTGEEATHISETALTDDQEFYDYYIMNDETLEVFLDRASGLAKEIKNFKEIK